jgi:hypothetical protein
MQYLYQHLLHHLQALLNINSFSILKNRKKNINCRYNLYIINKIHIINKKFYFLNYYIMPSNSTLFYVAIALVVVLVLLIIGYYIYQLYSSSSAASTAAALQAQTGANVASVTQSGGTTTGSVATYPAGLSENQTVRCNTNGYIYTLVNGTTQWYPNPTIYAKYGSPPYTNVDCNVIASIPAGPNFS